MIQKNMLHGIYNMFSILDGIENFSEWLSNGPVGWVFMNPLALAVLITLIIVFLHETFADEDDDKSLTKFIVYTFLAILIPIIVNNNAIDRKVVNGSYDMTADDFDVYTGGGRDIKKFDVGDLYE